jgi:hypothetical protein
MPNIPEIRHFGSAQALTRFFLLGYRIGGA